MYDLPN